MSAAARAASRFSREGRRHDGAYARSVLRAALLGFVVGLPLLSHPPIDDDRFDPFRWGATYASRPSGIIIDQLRLTRFHLTVHGNFRPAGRMLERAQDTIVWVASDGFGIPMHLVLRFWFALSVALLSGAVVVLVAFLTTRSPSTAPSTNSAVLLAPLAVPLLMIASGPQAPLVNFADIYLQTMALVLVASMAVARSRYLVPGPVRAAELALAVFVGVLIAGFNELGVLALPLMLVVLPVRALLVHGATWKELLSFRASRLAGAMVTGFLLLFVPIRLWLSAHCVENHCHAPSLIRMTSEFPLDAARRAVSWLPLLAWNQALDAADGIVTAPSGVVIGLLLAIAAVTLAVFRDLRTATRVPRAGLAGLVIIGCALLVLGASLGAASVYVQTREFGLGTGWRDTAVTATGGAFLLVAFVAAVLDRQFGRFERSIGVAVAGLFLIGLSITVLVNDAWNQMMRENALDRPYAQMSLEMVDLDPSPVANERRCQLVVHVLHRQSDDPYLHERLEPALNTAARRSSGRPFCERP